MEDKCYVIVHGKYSKFYKKFPIGLKLRLPPSVNWKLST